MLLQLATTSICLNWQFDNVCYKLAHVAKVKDYEDTPGQQFAAASMLLLLRSSTRPCWTAGPASSWSPQILVVKRTSLVQDDGSTGTSIECDRSFHIDLLWWFNICIFLFRSHTCPICNICRKRSKWPYLKEHWHTSWPYLFLNKNS